MLSLFARCRAAAVTTSRVYAGAQRTLSTEASEKLGSFGALRFDDDEQRRTLSPTTYEAVQAAIQNGTAMDKATADDFAATVKKWAMERGAVNYSHIFYPHRGMKSGQKKDAFIDLDFSDPRAIKPVIEDFNGSKYFMSETDGSSFPNGGLRQTHTAAAYMQADRTSPPYIFGDTLCIPSSLVTWTGHSIDNKTGLLRSQEAVTAEGTRLLHHLGFTDVTQVSANVGWEQEFFMIPRELVVDRPDIIASGRTVLGAAPPRGQQLSDHYFSKINPRVRDFFVELQSAMWETGVSNVVYHNEVAPSQHELSPIFKLTNVAADENILVTELMQEISLRHGFIALNHEKPFAGINGSGKHCNWGLNADNGMNLYVPGKTAEAQRSFVAFTAALMHAFAKYPEAIRASVATSGNDHRLGADEAPPAIFSVSLGAELGKHFESVANGGVLEGYDGGRYGAKMIESGSKAIGPIGGSREDRNRTAPIPFCGNRFEFRAVGSNQNISLPMTVLNTAVADGCAALSDAIESGASLEEAVQTMVRDNMNVVFNGDGYSEEWHKEAEFERGLPNLKDTFAAWNVFDSDKNKELFSKHNVYTGDEVVSLQNINLQRYSDDVEIEADVMLEMINTAVLPAAAEDLNGYEGTGLAGNRSEIYGQLAEAAANLQAARDVWPTGDEAAAAEHASATIKPLMATTRTAHDAAERLIEKALYPYPTYYDMLHPHQDDY
mmetsp:Transcript_31421/g.82408  ORF Transcript_31421/g.82408 Transcript_31421/m.82408 type:complete len:720 (-) Transcript_31421:72-2231(-)